MRAMLGEEGMGGKPLLGKPPPCMGGVRISDCSLSARMMLGEWRGGTKGKCAPVREARRPGRGDIGGGIAPAAAATAAV